MIFAALPAAWVQTDAASPSAKAVQAPPAAIGPKAQTTVQAVTVTAAQQAYRSDIDRKSYSLSKDLQAATGSLADALRNVPSVEVDLQGGVSLRGDPGVTILVDGKPSALFSGPNKGDVLLQLPADQYERVEVMTNPSAAFRPDGTGGIINLVSKKGRGAGVAGTVKGNVGTGGRANGGLNGSFTNDKLTLSGSLNMRRDGQRLDLTNSEQLIDPATGAVVPVEGRGGVRFNTNSIYSREAVDYDLDAKTRLSADFTVTHGASSSDYGTTSRSPLALQNYSSSSSDRSSYDYVGGSATYLRKFSGEEHEFSLNASVARLSLSNRSASTYTYADALLAPSAKRTESPSERPGFTLKAEYKQPLADGGKLVTGYDLDVDFGDFINQTALGLSAAALSPRTDLSDRFKADQAVHGLYVTYQRSFGDFTVEPGLRLEDVQIHTHETTTGEDSASNYANAYPTLHLGYQLDDRRKLTASFSRRVQRPELSTLNPFRFYQTPLSYSQGDPDLRPEITESFETGWEYRHNTTSYQATVFYRLKHDQFTTVRQDLGDGVLLSTQGNAGQSRSGGLEFVATGKLPWKLSYNTNASLFWNELNATNLDNGQQRSGVSGSVRGSLTWEPTDKDYVQLNGNYRGRTLNAQGYSEPTGLLNIGYRRKLTDAWSSVFQLNDLLSSFNYSSVIDTPTLKVRNSNDLHGRTLYVGLTYAFGGKPGAKRRAEGFDFSGGSGGPP